MIFRYEPFRIEVASYHPGADDNDTFRVTCFYEDVKIFSTLGDDLSVEMMHLFNWLRDEYRVQIRRVASQTARSLASFARNFKNPDAPDDYPYVVARDARDATGGTKKE